MVLKMITPAAVLLLLLTATLAPAIEITSVRPTRVSPGDNLYLSITPPQPAARVVLGDRLLDAEQTETGLVFYRIPDLTAGVYTVQLQIDDQLIGSDFMLTVLEPVPVINALSPANVAECAEIIEKRIDLYGRNFLPDSRLLVNGAGVAATFIDRTHISFDAAPLRAGAHGLQVVNPAGSKSLPFTLYINNVPYISDISPGQNYTNHYELVIRGGNFYQQSTLLVTTAPLGMSGIPPRQKVVWGKGRRTVSNTLLDQESEDFLFYEDCNTLIYYRFPLSGQDRDLTLKVVNPDGKASASYRMFAN